MNPLPLLQLIGPDRWPAFALISARVGGLMLAAPLWSMSTLPRATRAAITVVLSVLLLASCPAVKAPEEVLQMPLPMAMEGLVGLVIGLTAAVLIQAVALGGEVLSLQMGLSLGQALAPSPDLEASGVAQFQTILALLIYTSAGGHLMLLQALAESLRVLPPGSGFGLSASPAALGALPGTLFSCAIRAAAPVMVALLLANVALAVMSRAVPQLNAMMVAFPLTIGIGLIVSAAAMPLIAATIRGWIENLPIATAAALHGFQAAGSH
ncbi:MAG TPA: flagellar biosynthetic protein FliR [Candidatus Sulfotelmatobacter sp.]|nr:flagellar biosynthetic protein FliR [Candidatus Sulfotelmatobacter sp.]